jgi:glycosyltransferase involved in cell wall biosynthesis
VLEAMAFDVPIIARACAAIPETVADGGLLLPPWAGAELIAEAIARVIEDSALRRDLVTRGRNRLREFTEMDASVSMLAAISEVV